MASNDANKNELNWIKNPKNLLSSNKNGPSCSNDGDVTKTSNNEAKKLNVMEVDIKDDSNKNDTNLQTIEMTCLNIFEKLVTSFKSENFGFVRIIDNFCNMWINEDQDIQKLKVDLIENLLINLAHVDLEELRDIKKQIKGLFLPEFLKKIIIDDKNILIETPIGENLFIGYLIENNVSTDVLIECVPSAENLMNQVMILSKLNHPNIIKILVVNRSKNKILYKDTNEYRHFSEVTFISKIQPKDCINILIQIAMAVNYVHKQKIIYRHLSHNSILIYKKNIKLFKFEHAVVIDESIDGYIDSKHSTKSYFVSPETIESKKFTTKTDVWEFGLLCWEIFHLISNIIPFSLETILDLDPSLRRSVRAGYVQLKRPNKCPEMLYSYIISKLLHIDPNVRPSFDEIVRDLENFEKRYW